MSGLGRWFKRHWKKPDGTAGESKYYSISFPFEGKTRIQATAATTEAAARKELLKKLEEIGRGDYAPGQSQVVIEDLVELLKADYRNNALRSLDDALKKLKPVLAHFRGWRVVNITIQKIDRFI